MSSFKDEIECVRVKVTLSMVGAAELRGFEESIQACFSLKWLEIEIFSYRLFIFLPTMQSSVGYGKQTCIGSRDNITADSITVRFFLLHLFQPYLSVKASLVRKREMYFSVSEATVH